MLLFATSLALSLTVTATGTNTDGSQMCTIQLSSGQEPVYTYIDCPRQIAGSDIHIFVDGSVSLPAPLRINGDAGRVFISGDNHQSSLTAPGRVLDIEGQEVYLNGLHLRSQGEHGEDWHLDGLCSYGGGVMRVISSTLLINGKNIVEGGVTNGNGGGICAEGSNITVDDKGQMIVQFNSAQGYGGGIYITGGYLSATHLVLTDNLASYGGGIAIFNSRANISVFLVQDNVGGGVYIHHASSPSTWNRGKIVRNIPYGIKISRAALTMLNTMLDSNGEVGLISEQNARVQVEFSTITGHKNGIYVDYDRSYVGLFASLVVENRLNCLGGDVYPAFSIADDDTCPYLPPSRNVTRRGIPFCNGPAHRVLPADLCDQNIDANGLTRLSKCTIGAVEPIACLYLNNRGNHQNFE